MDDEEAPEQPGNVEVEQALLGAIFVSPRVFDQVHFLKPEHFLLGVHGRIFAAILKLASRGEPANPVTLKPLFEADEALTEIGGGAQYLVKLALGAVSAVNAAHYGRIILDLYKKREILALGQEMVEVAQVADLDTGAEAIIRRSEQRLYELDADTARGHGPVDAATSARATMDQMEEAHRNQGRLLGIPSGLQGLDDLLGGFQPQNFYILGGRPSMGKAQPLDAAILLAHGAWTTMGALRLGQRLASIDGAPSRVQMIHERGSLPVYRVTFSDGRSTRVCGDHLWRVTYREWDCPRVLSTQRVAEMLSRVRYRNRLSVDLLSGDFGAATDLPVDPYVLGAILGDGSTANRHISLSSADEEIIGQVRSRLGLHCSVRQIAGSRYGYSITSLGTKWLPQRLRDLGVMGKLSGDKFVPACYLASSRQQRLDLIRGLMDTDGWAEKHAAVRFTTTSRRLAEDVNYLVRSLGGLCSIIEKQPYFTSNGIRQAGARAYVCRIRHGHAEELFGLQRKRERAKRLRQDRMPALNFKNIELVGNEPVRCITVTHPSSLYITDDFIVTHNSIAGAAWVESAARHFLIEAAGKPPRQVAEFSLEMSHPQITRRRLSARTEIPLERLKRGDLSTEEADWIINAARDYGRLPILTDDTPGLTLPEFRSRLRRLMRRPGGVGLAVIDHLQIMRPSEEAARRGESAALTEITGGLKTAAKDFGIPIVALSQLSRDLERRDDKRPMLADLRQSGSIEQDADVVMFIYREEYYLQRDPIKLRTGEKDEAFQARKMAWEDALNRHKNRAEIIVAKQRDGATGIVNCYFDGATATIRHHDQHEMAL